MEDETASPSIETTDEAVVYIVDDDAATRDSLQWLVESVGLRSRQFAGALEFLDAYDENRPACLVLDVRMPGMSGLELQQRLTHERKRLPVIFITGFADVPMAVQAMKCGAIEFLEKPFSDQVLLDCIQRALKRDAETRRRAAARREIAARVDSLTPREREVMCMVVSGRGTKAIAHDLGLSPKTVEIHRAHIMEKMKAESIATLVRYALLVIEVNGLAHPDEPGLG